MMTTYSQLNQSYYATKEQPPRNVFTTTEINIDKDLAVLSAEEIEAQIRRQQSSLNDPFNKLK